MTKICIGCGKLLQNENKDKEGFTPNLNNTYCMRCFRLKNYGEKDINEEVSEHNILKKLSKKNGLVFFMIDYLNINAISLNIFKKINLPKILVISKSDILRKDMKYKKIKNWLNKVYDIKEETIFLSNKNNFDNINIFKYMDKYAFKTCFIMGITNAGKSTFMNSLLKKNKINKEIIVSNKPNTTLDFIKIKIADYIIYDTPGFNYTKNNYVIKNEIKPFTFMLKKETNIILDEKYHFLFKDSNSVTIYSFLTNIKRSYKDNDSVTYSYKVPDNYDLVLPGIGFLNIKKASIVKSNLENLEIRPDISGGIYE